METNASIEQSSNNEQNYPVAFFSMHTNTAGWNYSIPDKEASISNIPNI
jgi:hypothetical protein